MCEESIKEKIKKTLALAERAGTEEEAKTALAKAQELMLKYSVEIGDLRENTEIALVPLKDFARTSKELKKLALTLSKHFPVEIVIEHSGHGTRIGIIGYKEDAENFKIILLSLEASYLRLRNKTFMQWRKVHPGIKVFVYREGYCTGYCRGLNEAFTINETEKGLIVVTPLAVSNHLSKMSSRGSALNFSGGVGLEEGIKHGSAAGSALRHPNQIEN